MIKKFFLILAIMLLIPIKTLCADIMPQYVSIEQTNTLGLYQAPNEIVIYKEPSETSTIIHSISWIGNNIFPETITKNKLFVVYLPDKNLGLIAVSDETEDWVQIIYDHQTGAKGWIKNEDPYRFMSWIMFYNMYGKKYGLKLLKEAPEEAKDIHTSTNDKSQIVGKVNMPQKINLTAIKGNWALVSVFDIDRTPKTGYIKWRNTDGVKYYFPEIK